MPCARMQVTIEKQQYIDQILLWCRQGRISFAAGLHPLEVSTAAAAADHEGSGVFRTW